MTTVQSETSPITRIMRYFTPKETGREGRISKRLPAYLEALDTVRREVEAHAVEPNPENYALFYRYFVQNETHLGSVIGQLIASGYAPLLDSDDLLARSEQELNEIADSAQIQLQALEAVITNSRKDTSIFGDALEGNTKHSESGDNTTETLIELTRSMIKKTRFAEEKLREQGEAIDNLRSSLSEVKIKADTDFLTGLSNRRAFERSLGAATARAELSTKPLALAICDVDHFKSVNDNFGHDTGDRVLKLIAEVFEAHCGKVGKVFRFGGEEFVLLFEGLSANQAYQTIDAARCDLVERVIIKRETQEPLGPISFSAGISAYEPGLDSGTLLGIADRALYEAKSSGRNRIHFG